MSRTIAGTTFRFHMPRCYAASGVYRSNCRNIAISLIVPVFGEQTAQACAIALVITVIRAKGRRGRRKFGLSPAQSSEMRTQLRVMRLNA